jgi:hypothetical protein
MHFLQIFASAFLAILFLQSGIDKVVDRRGNLEWLKGHFAKSPLAGVVPALVTAKQGWLRLRNRSRDKSFLSLSSRACGDLLRNPCLQSRQIWCHGSAENRATIFSKFVAIGWKLV